MKKATNWRKYNAEQAAIFTADIIATAEQYRVSVWTVFFCEYGGIDNHAGLEVEKLIADTLRNMADTLTAKGIY